MSIHRAAGLNQLFSNIVGKSRLRRGQFKSTSGYVAGGGNNTITQRAKASTQLRKVKITLAEHS